MLFFARMLELNDDRWLNMHGGYRALFDPRPCLAKLESGQETDAAWHELWEELHHQGDVGEASYAAVPHLVRIYRERLTPGWNTYAMVSVIELARTEGANPQLPAWLETGYFQAIQELAEIGVTEVLQVDDSGTVREILAVIAIAKGLRAHGKFLFLYSEDEMLDLESRL
jgi:hypothetical protein